ncbi:hypothetical protein CEF21_17850 [Bacillus sp. FJAT-42376]|nr:hypothetical protein CEF21_17850 [Bacillus sp. FJAT-42376]
MLIFYAEYWGASDYLVGNLAGNIDGASLYSNRMDGKTDVFAEIWMLSDRVGGALSLKFQDIDGNLDISTKIRIYLLLFKDIG